MGEQVSLLLASVNLVCADGVHLHLLLTALHVEDQLGSPLQRRDPLPLDTCTIFLIGTLVIFGDLMNLPLS